MPEKPKRRKPNKNQRNRNKNKQEQTKNNNVENVLNSQSCSATVDENKQTNAVGEGTKPETSIPLTDSTAANDGTAESLEKSSNSEISANQDLNSNSTELPDLNTVHSTKVNVELLTDVLLNDTQYVVESPEQSLKTKPKLNTNVKSKSLDNEEPTKIVEITEECALQSDDDSTLQLIDSSVLVSDVESDIEWEKTDDLLEGPIVSRDLTKPLTTCDIPITVTPSEQSRTLTREEVESLRNCLQNLPLTNSTYDSSEVIVQTVQVVNHGVKHKLRKKASADDFIFHRLGPPRTLDVIDEEGSSESSKSSRRQSYLSEKKNDHDDLDDEVFEDVKKTNKFVTKMHQNKFGRQIQQQCMLLDTKLKEPEISEARGDWSVTKLEKMTGAEIVYLTDTSSSTSSVYDNSEDGDADGDEGVETDTSVRMITPTIEVTDTETLLKGTLVPSHESVPNVPEVIEIPVDIKNEEENNIPADSHEIIVLSTDEIKTNLTVKDLESDIDVTTGTNNKISEIETQKTNNGYDLEMKVLKCELNDAINNLIKEVSSDSESSEKNGRELLNRQDSSSSVGSSQCTAKYNPTYSSLNDVANIVHDDMSEPLTNIQHITESSNSHVNDVFECVTGISSHSKKETRNEPSSLKDLCVQKIARFPFGDKILEELASVSKRLQNITIYSQNSTNHLTKNALESEVDSQPPVKMPYYPLPDVSSIEKVTLPSKDNDHNPPPVHPRNSSLKISQNDNHWVGMPTETEPVYVCLSPSQKMLMEKTNTVITKEDASQLVDMHKKYVDRRGYNEYYDKELRKENQRADNSPVVPFKSQTGSRLLALIRDPTVTDNINSMKSKNQLKILDQIGSTDKKSQAMSFKKQEHHSSARDFSSNLKPVPPPRTRKFSSSIYESDESSDFTDSSFRSIKNERKSFHYSTGNLSKEIEDDISSIQNMHRHYTDIRDKFKELSAPRRPSLPKDLCDQQMEYIRRKEKEVEAEIRRLESEKLNFPVQQKQGPRAPMISETKVFNEQITRTSSQSMLLKKDSELKFSALKSPKVPEKSDKGKLSVFSSSQEELLREKMYSEYVNQMAEREERRQQKVIKITNNTKPVVTSLIDPFSKSMPSLDFLDSKVNNRIEKEFIWKARERWNKLGIKDPETEDERDENNKDVYKEPKVTEHKIKVIEGGEEKDVKKLPNHLQEFVRFTVKDTDQGKSSPGESSTGPASPHVMILCAVIILMIAVSKMFWRMLRNK